MKYLQSSALCAFALLMMYSTATSQQQKPGKREADKASVTTTFLNGTGKAAAIVVGAAAKVAWGTTKFVTKRAALPTAKIVLLKAPGKVGEYGLKTLGFSLRKGIPAAGKVGFAYLKAKLP